MTQPAPDSVLRLAPGYRLGAAAGQEDLLLIPEGVLRLKGPARSIVELCDGRRAFREILESLQQRYPSAGARRIESEASALIAHLLDRGALEYL